MKKVFASIITSFVLLFLVLVPQASAKVLTSENGDVNISKTEIINDDLFIGAQGANIEGVINGDLFIGAQTVKINGTVNGNLHIGAQTINLSGTVKGNVYAGTQNFNISSAKIGGSVITGGQNITIDSDSMVGGSIITGASSVNINTTIKRNLMVGAGFLTIGEKTIVGKDLYYASGSETGQTNISDKAIISGEIHKANTATAQNQIKKAEQSAPKMFAKTHAVGNIFSFLGALIIGLITIKTFNPFITKATETIKESFWKSMGIGFLVMIGILPGIVILLLTVVGIPLIGIVILLLMLYGYMAKIIFANALGIYLKEKTKLKTGNLMTFTIGLILIYLIKIIPVIGGIFGMLVFWVGLGSIVVGIFKKK